MRQIAYRESILALAIGAALRGWVLPRNLGIVTGSDGMLRLFPKLVRIPDVAFTSWARFPGGKLPDEAVPNVVPDLAVEVLSESNTDAEMKRKREEYFAAGVRLLWIVDGKTRTAKVYTGQEESVVLRGEHVLEGGTVLPGFALPLKELFAEVG